MGCVLTIDRRLSVGSMAHPRGGHQRVDGVGSGHTLGRLWQSKPPFVPHTILTASHSIRHSDLLTRQKYPMTPLNIVDLLLVLFCGITLIVTFTSPCSDGSMCTSIQRNDS